jgi:hypothetical protein
MRIAVWTMSQIESSPGILSAKNSTKTMKPLAASTTGWASRCRPLGSGTSREASGQQRQYKRTAGSDGTPSSWGISGYS